jgi:hypothetical protein
VKPKGSEDEMGHTKKQTAEKVVDRAGVSKQREVEKAEKKPNSSSK